MTRVKVKIWDIDWDIDAYDDNCGIDLESIDLPKSIDDFEFEIFDTENMTEEELKDEEDSIEEQLMDILSDEYGFCINNFCWEYIKYEAVKHETKDYWYVWNLMKNEEVCDEDGEPYHFDSLEETKQYIENLKDLSNE